MNPKITKKQAQDALESGYRASKAILTNKKELEKFLLQLEAKAKKVPFVGQQLATIPAMISLIKHFAEGSYKKTPYGSLIAIVSALLYFLSPFDIIPDFLPLVGYVDDAAVIKFCLAMAEKDMDAYNQWRKEQGLI